MSARRKKVFRDTSYLSRNHIPNRFIYRDEEVNRIMEEVEFQFEDKIGANLLISGPAGTGKTHCLKKICDDVNKREDDVFEDGRMLYVKVNGRSVYDIFVMLNQNLRDYPFSGFSFNKVVTDFAEFLSEIDEKVILVFDEVDKISDTRDTGSDPFDKLVYHITRLGEYRGNDELELMNIMVTNDPAVKEKINGYSLSTFQPEHIHFSVYDANQIEKIISDRVEKAFLPGVVPDSVVGWLSATIYKGHSDIRYGLMALKYAGKALIRGRNDKMTVKDLEDAIEQIEFNHVKSNIKGLNEVQFAALISLIIRDKEGASGVNSEDFYEKFEKICRSLGTESRAYSYVRRYVMPKLENQGLITSRLKGLGRGKGQIMIYYVRGLGDMLPVAAEVALEDYGMVMRVNGEEVLDG
ncbi:MAG: AAA family ATPase [Thermoplasmata archaeon]